MQNTLTLDLTGQSVLLACADDTLARALDAVFAGAGATVERVAPSRADEVAVRCDHRHVVLHHPELSGSPMADLEWLWRILDAGWSRGQGTDATIISRPPLGAADTSPLPRLMAHGLEAHSAKRFRLNEVVWPDPGPADDAPPAPSNLDREAVEKRDFVKRRAMLPAHDAASTVLALHSGRLNALNGARLVVDRGATALAGHGYVLQGADLTLN